MRKILPFLMLALIICLGQNAATAQTKKVAILETFDKNEDYTYGARVVLRSKLTAAVNKNEGYEALDRIDLSSITKEQNFQRSGMVSDSEIKQIGELSGADYILVSEIAKVSEQSMVLSAKIVSVETGKIENAADDVCSSNVDLFEEGCMKVVRKLFTGLVNEYGQEMAGAPEEGKIVLYFASHKDLIKSHQVTDTQTGAVSTINGIDVSAVTVIMDKETIGSSVLKDGFLYKIPATGKHEITIKVASYLGAAVTKVKIDTNKASYYEFIPKFNSIIGRYKLEVSKKM